MTGAAIAAAVVGVQGLKKSAKDSRSASESMQNAVGAVEGNVGLAHELNAYLQGLGIEQQDFADNLMADWEGTFGGIQDNLSEYYNNLDPVKFATQNKMSLASAMDKQVSQMNESFATSGIQTGGMKMQAQKEAAFTQAQGNAAIDIAAPEQVAQMQQGFLNFGEGQRTTAFNAKQNAFNAQGQYAQWGTEAMMTANRDIANAYSGYGQQQQDSASGWAGAGGNLLGGAMGLGIAGGWGKKSEGAE